MSRPGSGSFMDPVAPSPNILLTNACLRSCAYCFADTVRPSSRDVRWMTEDGFAEVLDWLEVSRVTEIRLLGGEPLLHPLFAHLLETVEARGFFERATVFSSLLAPAQNLERLVALARRTDVRIVANIAELGDYEGPDRRLVLENLATAVDTGIPVTLAQNIYSASQDVRWLVPFCRRYGIGNVRLAIANPSGLGTNTVLAAGDRFAAGELLTSIVRELDENGIAASLDCLVTPCMFREAAWAYLSRALHRDARSFARCYPALDIAVDLSITRCFGTNTLETVRIEDFQTTRDAWEHFVERIDGFRRDAVPRQCRGCPHFQVGHCSGRCIGFSGPALAAARSDSDRADKLIAVARDALRAREVERAIDEFERAFELSTHDAAAVCDYVASLVSTGRIAEASAAATRHAGALDSAPVGLAAFVRGLLAEAGGDRDGARGYYRQSLRHADGTHRDRIRERLKTVGAQVSEGGTDVP